MWANAHTASQKHTEIESFQVEKATKRTSLKAQTLRNSQILAQNTSESEAFRQNVLRNWLNVPLCKQCVTIRFQLELLYHWQRTALVSNRIKAQYHKR